MDLTENPIRSLCPPQGVIEKCHRDMKMSLPRDKRLRQSAFQTSLELLFPSEGASELSGEVLTPGRCWAVCSHTEVVPGLGGAPWGGLPRPPSQELPDFEGQVVESPARATASCTWSEHRGTWGQSASFPNI